MEMWLKVKHFNEVCNTPERQAYIFNKKYGFVGFEIINKIITRAYWRKTKKEAIAKILKETEKQH
jgi:hypothetical protein